MLLNRSQLKFKERGILSFRVYLINLLYRVYRIQSFVSLELSCTDQDDSSNLIENYQCCINGVYCHRKYYDTTTDKRLTYVMPAFQGYITHGLKVLVVDMTEHSQERLVVCQHVSVYILSCSVEVPTSIQCSS